MPQVQTHLLTRWLAYVLAAVIWLGPFLHGHIGVSHETGFHLDGVHALHTPSGPTGLDVPQWDEEESYAVGPESSFPQNGSKSPSPDGATWVFFLLLLAFIPACMGRAQGPLKRFDLYRAGWPPPGLAPPTL